jgi:hypothetical protein
VRSILQLAIEHLERIAAAGNASNALHVADEMLEGVYDQLESLLEAEPARHDVLPFPRRAAATVAPQKAGQAVWSWDANGTPIESLL